MSSSLARSGSALGDIKRIEGQNRIVTARNQKRSFRLLWLLIGPGLLVMIGENDAPSMLSYTATGASFGIGFFLPFVPLTFALAYLVQEMTVRLGAVTRRGHAALIFERFGPAWGWWALGELIFGNFLTIVAEFIGIITGLSFFSVPNWVAVLGSVVLVLVVSATARYRLWERLTLVLAAGNAIFVPIAILSHPHWGQVAVSFATWSPLPHAPSNTIALLLLANIGATVTPWMIYFQQSIVVDKGFTISDIRHGRIDTALGAGFATIFGLGAMIVGSSLFPNHLDLYNAGAGQFAQALEPHLGSLGSMFFAIGIVEAGLVALILIPLSSGFASSEITKSPSSLNLHVHKQPLFYGVLSLNLIAASAIVLIPGAPLLLIVLLVNVIAVLTMPPALILLFLLTNDKDIMGNYVNSRLRNIFVGLLVFGLALTGIGYGIMIAFPRFG